MRRAICQSTLVIFLALAAGPRLCFLGPAVAAAVSPAVVDRSETTLRVVATDTGAVRWQTGAAGVPLGAIPGPPGVVFASVASDGDTEVWAVRAATGSAESLGRVPGMAFAGAVAPDGSVVYLLEYPSIPLTLPDQVLSLPVPDAWRGEVASRTGRRETGAGILSDDGQRWIGVRPIREEDGTLTGSELLVGTFDAAGSPSWTALPLPAPDPYFSLLLSPDATTAYVVDYYAQLVHPVDLDSGQVSDSIAFGEERFKRPLCAAALSPTGDRLFVLGNADNAGDGILVLDTATGLELDHFFPGRTFSCLALTPDGRGLYASTENELALLDSISGAETSSTPLPPISVSLLFAVDPA